MDRPELLKTICVKIGKAETEALAALSADNKLPVSELLDLSFQRQQEIAFRAGWILETIAIKYPGAFKPLVSDFLNRYAHQRNTSCQRHFTKIMMCLTDPEYSDRVQVSSCFDAGPIIETTFEWLIDPKTPVAVQVNCMDVLFNLKDTLPWISAELQSQVVFLLHAGSPALQSRGKAILKKLSKSTKS